MTTECCPERPKIEKLPLFKVILHNDDKNDAAEVIIKVQSFVKVDENDDLMDKQLATCKVLEAHSKGCSLLTLTNQEHAELIVHQFTACVPPITATMESA